MRISKHLVRIFEGVYNEYGPEETLKRLLKTLRLNISFVYADSLNFVDNSIVINCENPITITIEDDHYYTKREYLNYTSYNYYDLDTILFRKAISFKTSDDKRIILDHLDSEDLESVRLLKTTKDDIDFNKGYIEREQMAVTDFPIEEVSSYNEYQNGDTSFKKVLYLETKGLYYYHHTSKAATCEFLETASCLCLPKYIVQGRARYPKDLLIESEHLKRPNVVFRGNTVDQSNNIDSYFDVEIIKYSEKHVIEVKIETINPATKDGYIKKYYLPVVMLGSITLEELEYLIYVFTCEEYSFKDSIVAELIQIRNSLLERQNRKAKEMDGIQLEMACHPNFDEFAFHIFENLEEFNKLLEKSTEKAPGEQEHHYSK